MKFRQEDLESEHLARPLRLPESKETWLQAVEQAEGLFPKLPAAEAGCLYLAAVDVPCTPDPAAPGFPALTRHFGSIRGAWPKLA